MNEKCYKKIDVSVFGDILKNKIFCENKTISLKKTYEIMQEMHTSNAYVYSLGKHIENEVKRINYQKYGFKSKSDYRHSTSTDVFDNKYVVTLIPTKFYELEDKIDLLSPITKSDELNLIMISDTFERIKIKAQNVIHETEEDKHIELYAKKNLQMLHRIFYDATNDINEICTHEKNFMFFKIFVLSTFIYNTILYYQNMFSRFYKNELSNKMKLRYELLNSIKIQPFMEQIAFYSLSKDKKLHEKEKVNPIVWNGQINTLVTLFYDLLHIKTKENKSIMEANIKDLSFLINKYVQDKNGNNISKKTVETILSEFKSEKRASGEKRIDLGRIGDF